MKKINPGDKTSWTSKRNYLADVVSSYLQDSTPENELEVFGKSVGLQLKALDNQQSIIAQKLISDVLFHAKMGKLNCESTINLSLIHI